MQYINSEHVMMTSSNRNISRVTGPLCGEFTGPGEFPAQRPVTRSFDAFFDLRLNKRLSKQPRGWWFETPSWSLWRQCNIDPIDENQEQEILTQFTKKEQISYEIKLLLLRLNLTSQAERRGNQGLVVQLG